MSPSLPLTRWRTTAIAILSVPALSFPGRADAQQPITGAMHAVASQYGGWLVSAFDSIPEGIYGFKPTPAQQTIGFVAQHLESSNYALCSFFGSSKHVKSGRDSTADNVKAEWPKDTLRARLRASFEFCERAVMAMTDADLTAPVRGGPTGVRADFIAAWSADLADHYSQIANYMRLNGLLPPSALPKAKRP